MAWTGSLFGRPFILHEPRLLLLALALGAVVAAIWLRRGRHQLPLTAVLVRTLVFTAFAVALGQPAVERPTPVEATVFVLDISRSMGGFDDERLRAVEARLRDAVASNNGRQPLGLVAFAERAVVVYPVGALGALPDRARFRAALDGADVGSRDYTDLTAALRLAEALPASAGKRLVLITDGQETLGDAATWVVAARARGVSVDTYRPDGRPWAADMRLSDLRMPESAWQGDDLEVETIVTSEAPGEATLRLLVDGRPLGSQPVTLQAGANSFRLVLKPLSPGFHAVTAEIAPQGPDAIAENNALAATTVVRDKPRILVLEGQRGNAEKLRRTLEAGNSTVTVREPGSLSERLPDLAAYDGIVLVDVPAGALSAGRQKALQEYVRTLGRGLVVTGGVGSFGRGGYAGTTLEETLPVRVRPREEVRRVPAALLIIIDTSYSMDFPRGAASRMEMAKTAAASAIRALEPGDEVAVLAFSDNNNWVTRLRQIRTSQDMDQVAELISRLKPEGLTQMYPALNESIGELSTSRAGTKHVVLLSDGSPSNPFDDRQLTGRMRAAGITLSSIAIGDGADTALMERLAKGGNGRYSFARKPEEIPLLTLEEAERISTKTVASGSFRAVQTAPSPIMRGLDPAKLPAIGGYQITEVKPDAQQILASGENEPVLAQWQYGLGRVVAWTSDTSQNLTPEWRESDLYAPFWNQAVRWTLAESGSRHFRLQTAADGRDLVVTVDAFDDNGVPVNLAQLQGTLRTSAGDGVPIVLPQSAPGRYEVRLSELEPDAYQLDLQQARGGGTVADVLGFSVPYPIELRGQSQDDAKLTTLAERTGGFVLTGDQSLFDKRGSARVLSVPRFQPVWPWFVALGLALFLLDITLRLGYTGTSLTQLRRLMPR